MRRFNQVHFDRKLNWSARELLSIGLACFWMEDSSSHAAGKKPPEQTSCSVVASPANPVRPILVRPVGTQVFKMPNGASADFQADLQSMLITALTQSSNLAPLDTVGGASVSRGCDTHLELRAAISTFQLNAVQLGFSIGFNPQGAIPFVTNIGGKAQMNIGNISMDFAVMSCSQGLCQAVAASTANHATVGGSLSFEVDFGMISTGPQLLINTPLGDVMRKIIKQGVAQLSSSPRMNEVPWQAHVKEYLPEAGLVVFDAGFQDRLAPNQEFEIYAANPGFGSASCDVFQVLAYAHTTTVNTVSSISAIDRFLGSRGSIPSSAKEFIQPGDLVMIHYGGLP